METGRLSLGAGLQQMMEDTVLRWDRTVDLSLSEVLVGAEGGKSKRGKSIVVLLHRENLGTANS